MGSILNRKILIVDDDERMLRALERVLRSEGAVVAATKRAGDAIELLREKGVNLIITDLRMPLLSGTLWIYVIHKFCPSLPIMVLTAFGSPEVKAECFRYGATVFLEKNLSTPQLLAVIKNVFAAQDAVPAQLCVQFE